MTTRQSKKCGSITVTHIDDHDVLLMQMHGGDKNQSVFNPAFIKDFNDALDYVEKQKGKKSLVLTGSGKFFSAGLDLKYMGDDMSGALELSKLITTVYKRLLLLNMPTIAALNGHTFGAGAFIAMCCDWRLMRKDCGRVCFPEVKIGINVSEGWRELISLKLPPQTLRTAILTGKQFTTSNALSGKLIDQELDTRPDEFIKRCIQFGQQLSPLAHNRENYSRLKMDLYYPAVNAMQHYSGISKL